MILGKVEYPHQVHGMGYTSGTVWVMLLTGNDPAEPGLAPGHNLASRANGDKAVNPAVIVK